MDNTQTLEVVTEKKQLLLALQKTILDISTDEEAEQILALVVEKAVTLMGAKGGSLYLWDTDYGLLNNEICLNLDPDYASISLKLGQGIAGHVAKNGFPLLVEAYHQFPNQTQIHPGPGFGPVAALPVGWQDQVAGVLELIREEGAIPFVPDDVDLLQLLVNQAAITLKSSRLLEESHLNAAQLATLNEVNRAISATLNRDAALRLVAEKAVEILQAEAGSIFLTDESGESLIFEIALGPTGMKLVGAKIPLTVNSIAGSIALSQTPMIVNNVHADPNWNTSFDDATEFRTRDILGVPMIAFDRVVGVIEVINKKNRRIFTGRDQSTLSIFAGQAAIALVNANRFTQTDQALADRVRELNTLELIDRELNASLNFNTVLYLTLSSMIDFLGASMGLIAIMNDDQDGLYFKSMVGVAPKYREYADMPWPVGRGVIGRTAQTGRLEVATGEQGDNLSGDSFTVQLSLPILQKDRVIGVISLERADDDGFTAEDQEFAVRLASHAVLAIQNARLFEQVQAANQAKSEFMSVTSHELKIPMTSIKGYARMLELVGKDSLSDQQREFLKIINSNVDRMSRLVSDLLDVSRIEAGRIKLDMGPVSIKAVVDDVLKSVHTQIETKKLQLVVDVPDVLPAVWADYGRLVQVLTNLVSNAYKYTPEGGNIQVRAIHRKENGQGENISVRVTDTGFGISEEDQRQLFSKFFRASDQNVRDVPGTGLGLAITKSLVELHGGTMWFESVLGQGSTFAFDLPVRD